MRRLHPALIWAGVAAAMAIPTIIAARSPLLAWRDGVYIAAGLAGVLALALLLIQPLLSNAALPGLRMRVSRRIHVWVGSGIVAAIIIHVGALWLTSPPDVIDALLFQSATDFSAWGVVAMWTVFATALLATLRSRLRLILWRLCHVALGITIILGSIVHALLIDGTMGPLSKAALCALVLAAAAKTIADLRLLADMRRLVGRKESKAGDSAP